MVRAVVDDLGFGFGAVNPLRRRFELVFFERDFVMGVEVEGMVRVAE